MPLFENMASFDANTPAEHLRVQGRRLDPEDADVASYPAFGSPGMKEWKRK